MRFIMFKKISLLTAIIAFSFNVFAAETTAADTATPKTTEVTADTPADAPAETTDEAAAAEAN